MQTFLLILAIIQMKTLIRNPHSDSYDARMTPDLSKRHSQLRKMVMNLFIFPCLILLFMWTPLQAENDTLALRVQNYSTENHSQIFLQWDSPACADWTHSTIERAMSDSVWLSMAIRPEPVMCMLDAEVEWNTEYRYRISCACTNGETLTRYSELIIADEVTHLDLHEYFLPQRWRSHEYLVNETQQKHRYWMDTTHLTSYRFLSTEQNITGGEDEIFEVISQIENGSPETTLVRFVTQFTDHILFYSDTLLAELGVPTIWKLRYNITDGVELQSIPDSARYIPFTTPGSITPDTLILYFQDSRWGSDYTFRHGFGVISGMVDRSGLMPLTYHHVYRIELNAPLGIHEHAAAVSNFSIDIFPNPAHREIHFSMNTTTDATAVLYDMLGRKLRDIRVAGNGRQASGRVSLQGISPGMYMLMVRTKDAVSTGKVIVTE